MRSQRATVTGWGRFGGTEVDEYVATSSEALRAESLPAGDLIARGLGRSYGDAAQRNAGSVVTTTECTTVSWVDRSTGLIRADAGVSIGALIARFAPKGWFVPVSPGTRNVTVGGAIAADIHGKNHHRDGSFGQHVRSLTMRLADDSVVTVGPNNDPELYWATVGGMGLTGIIIDAELQLMAIPSTSIAVETTRYRSLPELLAEMRRSDDEHAFSVAWVDLLTNGRSVLTQGSFAEADDVTDAAGAHRRPWTSSIALPPVPLPRVAVTPGVRVFNELWWRKAPTSPTITLESITGFFHPLDAITDWNRVYGGTGFVQWQCVVPDVDDAALHAVVARLRQLPAFFSVLKRFGPGNQSPLSFPIPGWTLAVDLPATPKTLAGLGALDAIVAAAGGRIYLAKDARMTAESFQSMYLRLDEFRAVRDRVDPKRRFASDLSVRLGI